MPCPIHNDKPCFYKPGQPYQDVFMPCWQYHNSPKHKALWDGKPIPEEERTGFQLVAPLGTADTGTLFAGCSHKKPQDYAVTVALPHLNTLETMTTVLDCLQWQTVRPYIMVIDTGSPPNVCAELEKLRAPNVEIHFIKAHGYTHSSEAVTAALDLCVSLCRTKYLFLTHTDCFPKTNRLLKWLMEQCNAETPVVGYRMSSRAWVTNDWKQCVGHTCSMLWMPTIFRIGATWTFERLYHGMHYPRHICGAGWPDTETCFSFCLQQAGLTPKFIGHEHNKHLFETRWIEHIRCYTGAKVMTPTYYAATKARMPRALYRAQQRVKKWKAESV